MLKGKYVESKIETINLKELNCNAFQILLEYIYSGVLLIDIENAGEVLKLADFLQLTWPKNECSKYLADSLTSENAAAIWDCARNGFCDELQQKGNEFILTNLKTVLNTEQFKKLELEKLQEIFQHIKMLSTPAEDVSTAIREWVKHDLPNRKLYFNALSKYIKTESVSERFFFSDISKETFLREEVSTLNWMLDTFCFSRRKENINSNIFVSSLGSQLNCYKYDTKITECTLLTRPSVEFYYPVNYKQNVYLTGGRVNESFPNVCPKYNMETKAWSEIEFKSDRSYHGSCLLNDKMYIVGGWDNCKYRNDVKIYDFETGQLISLESKMNKNRAAFGLAIQNGSIYTCGGKGCNDNQLNSVERLDPREGSWVLIPDMNDLLRFCTSAFVCDALYCSSRNRNIVEKFDIRLNSWENIPNLPAGEMTDNCLVEVQDQLYAVKRDGILKFNAIENIWNEIFSKQAFI